MPTQSTALSVRAKDIVVEARDHEVHIAIDDRSYRVRGLDKNTTHGQLKVNLLATRQDADVDFELINRCLVLAVSEDRSQTQAIHDRQRESRTLEGRLAARSSAQLVKLHQNAQRLLKPIEVINPFARKLTFLNDKTRTRRDHEKYLNLIDAIALLHQHQRELKTAEIQGEMLEYIEVIPGDIVLANRLAAKSWAALLMNCRRRRVGCCC